MNSSGHLLCLEGLNGRLPNQDLINSFQLISKHSGGVPITVYDHFDSQEFPASQTNFVPPWVPGIVRNNEEVKEYFYRAHNILRHVGYQARGCASGVHGLLHQ